MALEDVAQDVTDAMLGAAKNRGLKVFIVARITFQRPAVEPTPSTHKPDSYRFSLFAFPFSVFTADARCTKEFIIVGEHTPVEPNSI